MADRRDIGTKGPLAGVRVLDLTASMAGAVAAHLLAEVGGKVTIVEHIRRGQASVGRDRWLGAGAVSWRRRAEVVTLPPDEDMRSRLSELLGVADLVLHDLDAPAASVLGLDATSVERSHPDVVVVRIAGYPSSHPDAGLAGRDILVQAASGLMDETPASRPGPVFLRFPAPSWGAGALAAAGAVACLIRRARTGVARGVETSLLQGALYYLSSVWSAAEHPSPALLDDAGAPKRPIPWIFECADGRWLHTHIGFVLTPVTVEALAGLGEELPDVTAETIPDVVPLFAKMFRQRTAAEWVRDLREFDIDCTELAELGEVFSDPDAIADGHVIDARDPKGSLLRQAAAPFRIELSNAASPGRPLHASAGEPVLHGLRVLELGMNVSAPVNAKLMAELGAEVVKVEPPGGDRLRPEELLFLGAARGKRSLVLSLGADPEAGVVLRRLVEWADVVVQNLRPDKARKLGVDHASLVALKPDLVYSEVSSYAYEGPRADLPARDYVVGARSGFTLGCGSPSQGPVWTRVLIGDAGTALFSHVGTLAGIYHRITQGGGARVRTSMLGTAAYYASETALDLATGELLAAPRVDDDLTGVDPWYRIMAAQDGWVALAAVGDDERSAALMAFEVDDAAALEEAIARFRVVDVLRRLDDVRVPAAPVRLDAARAFLHDDRNVDTGLSTTMVHPSLGMLRQPGRYWSFDDEARPELAAPPLAGQHTDEILAELGYRLEERRALVESGTVAAAPTVKIHIDT